MIIIIYPGETYTIQATFKDNKGLLFDPDTHEITLHTPNGEIVETKTTPTKESLGVFTTSFNIPTTGREGVWFIMWTMRKGGRIDAERHLFKVRKLD